MNYIDQVTQMDCLTAMTDLPDQSVDVTLTDPPYPNRLQLFSESIADGYAALYRACRKTKNYVVFFWSNDKPPQAPPGWYEVARHIWHKPDCKSITHYENIIVWSRDFKRKTSRVWSIPILDYRSLRDWKPHPTQKPVRLIRYLLDLYTKEGDTVLDPFVGTGTTAVACKQMKRHFIAIDNDPEYVKMATQRLTTHSKQDEPAAENSTSNEASQPEEQATALEDVQDDESVDENGSDFPSQEQNIGEQPPSRPVAPTVHFTPTARPQRPAQHHTPKPRRPPNPTPRQARRSYARR